MEDIDNGTTDNTNSGTNNGTTGNETTPKSLDVGESTNKSLDVGEDSGKELEEGKDPHKTLPTRDHETKKINEQDHESKANDEAYEEPKEEVKADLFNLDYFDKPEEAPQEVTEKASELINGDLNYFDNWITEAEDQKKQNKEQLESYLKSNVESGNQLVYNSEDFTEGSNRINDVNPARSLFDVADLLDISDMRRNFTETKNNISAALDAFRNEVNRTGTVSNNMMHSLNEISRSLNSVVTDEDLTSSPYRDAFEKIKREIDFLKEKAEDIKSNGVTKNTGISAASEQQQINDSLQPAKDRYINALRSGDTRAIEEAKQNYERVANRVRSEFEGSGAMESEWGIKNKPEVFYPMAELLVSTDGSRSDEPETPPTRTEEPPATSSTPETPTRTTSETPTRTETPISTSVPTRTESVPETSSEPETTESETPAEETTTEEPESEETTTESIEPETSASSEDVIAKADEAKAAYEEAKKREYEAIHREADETEIAQLAAEAERLRQEWEEAEAEAADLRPREDGEESPKEPRIGHGREDRELSKEETLPEWVGGDDPHTSSAGAYWAGAFGDENWSDKVPQKTAQGLIDYANDHHDNPFAMFGMTALMEAGGYDFLKAGKDVQEMIATAKEVAANANKAIDFFKNGSVKDGIKSILSTGWSVLKVLGNTVSAAWNVCKSAFSFITSIFSPITSAIRSFLSTVNGYNSVKSMIRDMFGIENTDEVIGEIFGDNSETNTEQKPVNVLNKTGFSVKGGTVTDESDYNKGLKEKENEIASDVCKKIMLYFPYLRKAVR